MFFVIFHKNGKIIAVEEGDVNYLDWTEATFLKVVEVKRMGPRILRNLMNGKS